jgi:glycerophosphoryl diester phosphodiesterase
MFLRCWLVSPTALALLFTGWCVPCLQAAPLSIGHRGNSLFAPENTLASFRAALGKADFVELDGRVSSDGVLVVMHDATVTRTTEGTGNVSSLTLAQLKALDAGSWFAPAFTGERIPTLAESLATILPHATPLIEQKAGSAAAYVAELRQLGLATNIVLQSFDWAFLSAVHALAPEIRLAALGSGALTAAQLASLSNTGARIVAWEKANVTAAEVSLVHAAGFALFVWTADGAEIPVYASLGVDGIISNDPERVKNLQSTNAAAAPYLGDHLVAYWPMDDGLTNALATAVADRAGTNTGTLVRSDGASHWLSGSFAKFGGAFLAAGTNAYITLPRTTALNLNTNEATLSLWVQLRQLPSQSPEAFGGIFDSVEDSYVFYLDRSNQELRFKLTDAAGEAARPGIPEAALVTNQWLHLAATFTGRAGPVSGQTTIYLNGQPKDVHTGDDGNSPVGLTGNVKTNQGAALGRNGTQAVYPFNGLVDDVAVWNRALAPAEIERLHQRGTAGAALADLLREPTEALRITLVRPWADLGRMEVRFRAVGTWTSLSLCRSTNCAGGFAVMAGLAPVALGNGEYRFDFPSSVAATEYYRLEGK